MDERFHGARRFTHPPYFLEQELIRAVAAGDKAAAHEMLREYMTVEHPRLGRDDLRSAKNMHIVFCAILSRAAIQGGAAPDDAFSLSDITINRVEACGTVEEVFAIRAEISDAFIDLVRATKTESFSTPVSETVQYIRRHLTERMTLPALAERVHLHPNYLSSIFRKETGESVTGYILRQRVREAAQMLRGSSNSAADIARFYGFCNQSYFIKTFRRYMGCSPQEYREQAGMGV